MKPLRLDDRRLWFGSLPLLLAVLVGCPAAEPPPAAPSPPADERPEPDAVVPAPDSAPIPPEPVAQVEPAEEVGPPAEQAPAEPAAEEPGLDGAAPPAEEPVEPIAPEPQPEPAEPTEPDDTALDFPKPQEVDEQWQEPKPEPWELGPPLVDNVEKLKPLDPEKSVWIDMDKKRLVLVGKVCQREVPLELFACLRYTKEHEAVVVTDVKALTVHAGLLALGAEPGGPVQFNPEYKPPKGTEIEVTVRWKDGNGQTQTARAQEWIQNVETGKAMTETWVFAGSGFWADPTTGEKTYQAEGGDFICISNFATAMLDVPIESSQANQALMYRTFTERIPPLETPVTLILQPHKGETNEP